MDNGCVKRLRAVIAAHAAHTKANAHVHDAHGAPNAAVPADEAALFAKLLAKAGVAVCTPGHPECVSAVTLTKARGSNQ